MSLTFKPQGQIGDKVSNLIKPLLTLLEGQVDESEAVKLLKAINAGERVDLVLEGIPEDQISNTLVITIYKLLLERARVADQAQAFEDLVKATK